MIGILFFIANITIFGFLGFIVGIIFEWKSKKHEILRSEKRLLFYIVGVILWFFIMFGDEIIGMYQLKKLCESERIFLIKDVNKLNNKNLILEFDSKNRKNVRYSAIPIKYNISKYLDASNQSEIFTYKTYTPYGGWFSRMMASLIGAGGYVLFFDKKEVCKLSDYNILKEKYKFSISDVIYK